MTCFMYQLGTRVRKEVNICRLRAQGTYGLVVGLVVARDRGIHHKDAVRIWIPGHIRWQI